MIAYIEFQKIWDFQIPTTWNVVMMTSSLCFLNLSIKLASDNLQNWHLASSSKVPQNIQIWKPCDKKWRHNDIITKNNGKMRTSSKPNKLYIIRKVLMRAIQKCTFYWIWVTMLKVMSIYVKFWHFLRIWPCHVTQEANFEKNLFFPHSAFNIGKSSLLRKLSAKNFTGGVKNTPPSAFRVKD